MTDSDKFDHADKISGLIDLYGYEFLLAAAAELNALPPNSPAKMARAAEIFGRRAPGVLVPLEVFYAAHRRRTAVKLRR